jgi:hypothetical protein
MVPYSAFMKLEKYMDYQRLDTICTLLTEICGSAAGYSESGTAIKVIQQC